MQQKRHYNATWLVFHIKNPSVGRQFSDLSVGEEVGLLRGMVCHEVVDDVGVFLHIEHGANTVAFDVCDAQGALSWGDEPAAISKPSAIMRRSV